MKKMILVFVLLAASVSVGFAGEAGSGGLYTAVEYVFSEFFPINIGFKIGIEEIYLGLSASLNPAGDGAFKRNFALGGGIGSLLRITKAFFFNPEFFAMGTMKESQALLGLAAYFGLNIGENFSVFAGPSFTWIRAPLRHTLLEPSFSIFDDPYVGGNGKNNAVVAARAGVRVRF